MSMIQQTTEVNEGIFDLIASFADTVDEIYHKLIISGMDSRSLGFWILNIPENSELYSPTFRKTLGFEGEHDFPSSPESWQKAIVPEDLRIALDNYHRHVESKGNHVYVQPVTYNKKQGGQVKLLCHGKIIKWKNSQPHIMVGIHMHERGYYII